MRRRLEEVIVGLSIRVAALARVPPVDVHVVVHRVGDRDAEMETLGAGRTNYLPPAMCLVRVKERINPKRGDTLVLCGSPRLVACDPHVRAERTRHLVRGAAVMAAEADRAAKPGV